MEVEDDAGAALEAAVKLLEEGADAISVRLAAGIFAEEPVEEADADGCAEDAGAEGEVEPNVCTLEGVGQGAGRSRSGRRYSLLFTGIRYLPTTFCSVCLDAGNCCGQTQDFGEPLPEGAAFQLCGGGQWLSPYVVTGCRQWRQRR
jgi:hypothetical protein